MARAGVCAGGDRLTVKRGLSRLAERGPAEEVLIDGGGCWVGAAVNDRGDIGRFGRFTVALDGHPANLRALTAEQVALESGAVSPAEVVAAVFETVGVEQGLSRLFGALALVAWDAQAGELWAVRDRTGTKPMWVYGAGSEASWAGSWGEVGLADLGLWAQEGWADAGLGAGELSVNGRRRSYWTAPKGIPGSDGARVRWVRSLEYVCRMCIRHAGEGAVWADGVAGPALYAAAGHPVHGQPKRVSIAGWTPSFAELHAALDALASGPRPALHPAGLALWKVGSQAEGRLLVPLGTELWHRPQASRTAFLRRARPESRVETAAISEVLLPTLDVLGVALGVEITAPLADPRVVELGLSIPLGHHAPMFAEVLRALGAGAGSDVPSLQPEWVLPLVPEVEAGLGPYVEQGSLGPTVEALRREPTTEVVRRFWRLAVISRWLQQRGR